MTINVTISVNGDYKCPVSYKQGDREESQVVSGRGRDGPNVLHIPFYHSADVMTLSVGPEERDNGEAEAVTQATSFAEAVPPPTPNPRVHHGAKRPDGSDGSQGRRARS